MDLWRQRVGKDGAAESAPVPVTAGLGIRSAVFSSDGMKLAYSRGRFSSNVWRVPIFPDRVATWADAEQITFDTTSDADFVDVSPDGERLALTSDRAGNKDIWILPSDGGEMMQLTTEPTHDWAPKWSPDGAHIVFYSRRSGNRDIWVMPSDGGPARQLTSHPADDTVPTWSPDGREIAFRSFRDGNSDVWVVAAEGGEPVHKGRGGIPIWSPDGKWLVFHSSRSGSSRLWRVPTAGGEPEMLSKGPGNVARWSPDGRVLYVRGTEEREGNLWALLLLDGSERQVTDLTGRRGTLGYGLATDGQQLYFNWWEDVGDIWVMDVVTDESE